MSLREIFFILIAPFLMAKCFSSVLFGLGFFTCIIFLNPGSLFWGLDKYRIPLVFALTLLISAIKSKSFKNNLFYSSQHIIIVLFFILLLLSALNSYWPERSFVEIENWFKLIIYFFLFSHICSSVDDIYKMNSVIVCAVVVLSLRGLYRYASGYPYVEGLPNSYIADRNDFALALAMVLPLADSLYYYYKGVLKVIVKFIPLFLIITIILTYSRMGFILILVYLLLRILMSNRKILYILIVLIVTMIGSSFIPQQYVDRITGIKDYEEDASSMGRIVAWKAGYEMMKDNPMTGVGLNCFELPDVYRKYELEFPPHVAHNTYVQLGAEGGVLALFVFLSLVSVNILQLVSLFDKKNSLVVNENIKSLLVSFVIYLIGSVFISVENRELLYIIMAETVTIYYLNKMNLLSTS